MKHEWTDGNLKLMADGDMIVGSDGGGLNDPVIAREVLRLAARVRELEGQICEIAEVFGYDKSVTAAPCRVLAHTVKGTVESLSASLTREISLKATRAALEEENRRLRAELLARNEEIHEMDLELREEWPEQSE